MSDDLGRIIDIDGDLLLVRAFDMPDRPTCAVGLRVECASPTGIGVGLDIDGIAALRAALDKAETAYWKRMTKAVEGTINGCSCEPSASDRLFYKPRTIMLPNGEVRRCSPPKPPFEPCPAADDRGYGGMIVKATHPKRPSDTPSEPAKEATCNHIGERIRAHRRAVGLTLEDTAKAMGTSIPYASSVERGDITPTPDRVEELAKLFGIDAATLRSNS